MITDEIQELLDGGLGDERTAELLHSLSVSPEKRVAFQQHLGLRSAIQRDRVSSALTGAEDNAMWGSIIGSTAMPYAPVATPVRTWLARGAALVATGVAGYLLGTTTIVDSSSTSTDAQPSRTSQTVAASAAPATQSPVAAADKVKTSPAVAAQPQILYRDRVVYRDRIVYRDRVVYRDPIASAIDASASVNLATTDRSVAKPATSLDASNAHLAPSNASIVNITPANASQSNSSHGIDAANSATSSTVNSATLNAANGATSNVGASSTPDVNASTNNGASTINGTSSSPAPIVPIDTTKRGSSATASRVEPEIVPDHSNSTSTNMNGNDHDLIAADMGAETPSPIDAGGWDLVYAERVGILAPAPQKIEAEDKGFSYRLLGLNYWFGGGRFGAGVRAGYGSFSSVELSSQESSTGLGPAISGTVTSTERVWMEGVLAYRYPLTHSLALSIEAAIGGSTHHMKVSGDVVATYFVTDYIGLQAGAGLGRYWYSVAGARDRLLENTHTGGVTAETSTDYQGLMFEGRYGLFVRF
ncbi:MAG: hypothetical protein H7X80_04910 [bacterium]|nr:hypothetical protein [Candidatus Kapabacteria bacterium]